MWQRNGQRLTGRLLLPEALLAQRSCFLQVWHADFRGGEDDVQAVHQAQG